MRQFRGRLTATGCIAATLLFGSCSADDPANDLANDSPPATVPPNASTTPPSDTTTTIASPGSTVTSATAANEPTTSTTMLSFTGDPNSEWCVVAAELVVLSDAFEAASVSDPDEIERTLTAFVDRMALIAFIAPSDIVDDVALSVGAFGDILVLLEATAFDLGAADLSTIDAQREVLEESSNRIATYNRDVCGLDPNDLAAAGTIVPGGTVVSVASTNSTIASATESRRDAAIDLLTNSGYTTEEAECVVNEIENALSIPDVLSACGLTLEGSAP